MSKESKVTKIEFELGDFHITLDTMIPDGFKFGTSDYEEFLRESFSDLLVEVMSAHVNKDETLFTAMDDDETIDETTISVRL